MSIEGNKAAVRRLGETIAKANWSVLPELFAPNYVAHFPAQEFKGPEGARQTFAALKTAFPDYSEKIERMVAEDDLVAVFYTISGTFKGEYGGMKPTGKKFSIPGCVLAKFENGKQVEAWAYIDQLAWGQQMGMNISQG